MIITYDKGSETHEEEYISTKYGTKWGGVINN